MHSTSSVPLLKYLQDIQLWIDSQDDYNHHEIKSYAPKCSSAQTLSGCAQHPIHKHSVRMAYHDGLTITKPKLVCGAIKRRRETPGILRASLTALA
ncbi:unnamed protein product [Prunus armeniaca]|uniref:Uncharacterized protein n=1 Tax=Prunus armeniaca TaxID=36596 RepID=A0A6J5W6S6_PRUAR|nr:unnamed protein product [Prunus armeniaca]